MEDSKRLTKRGFTLTSTASVFTRDNRLTDPATHLRKREQDMRLTCNAISLSIKKRRKLWYV